MSTIDFERVVDCLADGRDDEWKRWDPEMLRISIRLLHIIRKIRTDVDAHVSIKTDGFSIFEADTKADVPITLNLPIFALLFVNVSVNFEPATHLDIDAITLCKESMSIFYCADFLSIPCQNWIVKVKGGTCV